MIEIRFNDLGHEYDGRVVFRSLSFRFVGRVLAVTGPNGAGKSTLMRITAGLLTPSRGSAEVVIDGGVAARSQLRFVVGLASPDVPLYPELTVRENLLFLTAARTGRADAAAAEEALERLAITSRGDDRFGELSSGLKRRACIAAAVVHRPVLLLLDEPMANLDAEGTAVVKSLIVEQRATGAVVVASSEVSDMPDGFERLELGATG